MNPLLGAAGPFFLGLMCVVLGVRLRKGLGDVQASRGARVPAARLPLPVRTRAGDANLLLGAAFLAVAACCLSPGPVLLAPIALCLLLGYPYLIRHRALRAAAEEVLRADSGG
ncbi:hypothetical protein [Actinocorallia populi]|uniref:hypothetical protein n=1 Tax=Actinocorallia populi TaxID=2079200 RepID=UPI000D0971ED|nr:hypothetical protein [Actinocorallia populi]